MEIECNIISFEEWEQVAKKAIGFTFFDSATWYKVFSWKVQKIVFLKFAKKSDILAIICLGIDDLNSFFSIKTPFSAPFGGFLTFNELQISVWNDIISLFHDFLCNYLSKPYFVKYIMRNDILNNHINTNSQEFALKYFGYVESEIFCDLYIDLKNEFKLATRAQTILNKIEKENKLIFSESTAEEFIEFRKFAIEQQSKYLTVPDNEILLGAKEFKNNICFYKIIFQNIQIATLLVDKLNKSVYTGRNWFMDTNYSAYNATLKMIHNFALLSIKEGASFLNLGASFQTAFKASNNASQFKERFRPNFVNLRRILIYKSTKGI
jgi:hypothetical protein